MRIIRDKRKLASDPFRFGVFVLALGSLVLSPGYLLTESIGTPLDGWDRLLEVDWPSRDYPTIQSAVDALANGGTLNIAEGVHEVNQPVVIQGKRLNIQGKGANCKDLTGEERPEQAGRHDVRPKGTELVGPIPVRVVSPERTIPHFEYRNAGGTFTGIRLTGFDAGIVSRDMLGSSMPLKISDSCFAYSVRGVLWKASSALSVSDAVIANMLWNGISISPSILSSSLHTIDDVFAWNLNQFCIYVEKAFAVIEDDYLVNCDFGGIAAYRSSIWVTDTTVINAKVTGIILKESYGDLFDNIIIGTDALGGAFGDGVVAWNGSYVIMEENHIFSSERAAVSNFGSYVAMDSNSMACQSFDMDGEPFCGLNFIYDDLGGNVCGCPVPDGVCHVVSSSLQPPPPVGGLE
jgi:hypothetical protein